MSCISDGVVCVGLAVICFIVAIAFLNTEPYPEVSGNIGIGFLVGTAILSIVAMAKFRGANKTA